MWPLFNTLFCCFPFQLCLLVASLDLDSYNENDPDGMFPLFYKQVALELAPKSAVIFRPQAPGQRG